MIDEDDDWDDAPADYSIGAANGLANDPRNPRLAGLRSVSYKAACALRKAEPPRPMLGFHIPRGRR